MIQHKYEMPNMMINFRLDYLDMHNAIYSERVQSTVSI